MKFLVALAAVAVAATAVAAYSHDDCAFTEYAKLAPVAGLDELQVCQDASGWLMIPPAGEPTAEQRAIMCVTPECFTLIGAVNATQPGDCDLVFGDVRLNVKQLVEEFEPKCFA